MMDGLSQQSGSIYDGRIISTDWQYLCIADYLSRVAVFMMDGLSQQTGSTCALRITLAEWQYF